MLLNKISIAENAFLQANTKGEVLLLIKDVLYAPQDIVPPKVLPAPAPQKSDARTYVMKCMVYEYGPNRSHWPEIARSFLAPAEAGHPEEV